jgi:tRNA U55 pseudouridine synthase TruB
VGKFNEKNSILLDDLLKMSEMAYGIRGFYSSISVLDDIPAFEVNNMEMLENISHGKKIIVNNFFRESLILSNKKKCFVTNKGKVISLGEIDGVFFKPKKVLL